MRQQVKVDKLDPLSINNLFDYCVIYTPIYAKPFLTKFDYVCHGATQRLKVAILTRISRLDNQPIRVTAM